MDTGRDFLRAQLNNAIAQHRALIENIRDHAAQADDPEYGQLCMKHLPGLERQQVALEAYGMSVGTDGGSQLKNAIGSVLGLAREAVDAMRGTDFLRVVGDVVMIRQAQDTFATFAVAGAALGDARLAELGRTGECEYDAMQRDYNDYCAASFVRHIQGAVTTESGDRNAASAAAHA